MAQAPRVASLQVGAGEWPIKRSGEGELPRVTLEGSTCCLMLASSASLRDCRCHNPSETSVFLSEDMRSGLMRLRPAQVGSLSWLSVPTWISSAGRENILRVDAFQAATPWDQ